MAEQIPLSDSASAVDPEIDAARNDKTHEIAPDLAYRWLGIVISFVFVAWCVSGIILVYYGVPHLTTGSTSRSSTGSRTSSSAPSRSPSACAPRRRTRRAS